MAQKTAASKTPSKKTKKDTNVGLKLKSRAALRLIEAGSTADCPYCGEPVKYKARQRDMQVICNIYENSVWQRVEQYHQECYKKMGSPYGKPVPKNKK